ncbi:MULTISPECIES: hypothetical protein [unclassified Nocardia]|uniref:hypothetical protein n=1 Tax=unclassified Nocardia TaxID=2637762 RepID=UPI00278C7228|nr:MULTISPECIES: hypothetical protein [unclassified Nocardia]
MATSASSSSFSSSTVTGRAVGTAAVWGALAGVAASMVMAAYAMIAAATYQSTGFFTPLYHIATTFIAPDTMMTSMERAGEGSLFYFSFGPAVLGAVIHMMVGAMYGALFGVIARVAKLHSLAVLTVAGMVWGLIVFAVSAWIGLPIAAALFGGGDPVSDMASMVGYPTFLVEHLLFGGALGMMLGWRASRK